MKKRLMRKMLLPAVGSGSAWLATLAAEKVMEKGMRKLRGRRLPLLAGKRSLAWTAASAALSSVAALAAEHGAERAVRRATRRRRK
ncbi:MAG TPA: hypothetical protein VF746_00090 [Longimicrobium sp.]|jgi:hypothetical protein